MINLIRISFIVGLFAVSPLIHADPITDIYTTGDTLTAATLNNIKSAVNDNDSDISANAADISTNTSGVSDNAAGVSTNAAGVSSNAADISQLQTSLGNCDPNTEVAFAGHCYYLDGSNGVCDPGYELARQSHLDFIASSFIGKIHKNTQHDNCCIDHADTGSEGQDWGLNSASCGIAVGAWTAGPKLGESSCTNADLHQPAQLTFCRSQ